MTHERLLEAYRMDDEIIANNIRIKKLLSLAIIALSTLALVLLVSYFCAKEALHPALKTIPFLFLFATITLLVFALVLFFIHLFFNEKLVHCVYDAHSEIYDRSLAFLCNAISETKPGEKEETILNLAYQKYIRDYFLGIFAENGEMSYPDYQMLEDYANYLYDMHNWDLSYIFRLFHEEVRGEVYS